MPAAVRQAEQWALTTYVPALARGDVDTLADYKSKAPGMPYAHPTVEHYTPLFVTLGAATTADAPGAQVIDGYWMGLSKRSLQMA